MFTQVPTVSHADPIEGRILIVEDEAILAEMTRRLLVLWGYEVVGVCNNGQDAVAQAGVARPDLVVMDIRLAGEMDGISAARSITSSLPVPMLFITGYGHGVAEDAVAQLPVPCLALVKPVVPQRLAEAVRTLLQGA